MVDQICNFLHNYFLLESINDTFEIASGLLTIPGIKEGQRFRVRGSALNDGIFTYHSEGIKDSDDLGDASLIDETFTGEIGLMGIPREVLDIAKDILAWQAKFGDALDSPYTSESFGGYSYTKKSGTDEQGIDVTDWKSVFGRSLIAWRKIG